MYLILHKHFIFIFFFILTLHVLADENLNIILKNAIKEKMDSKKMLLYNNILDKDPDFESAIFNRGILFLKNSEWLEAKIDFKHYLTLELNNAKAYNNLGICYFNLNKFPGALKNFEKALLLSPSDVGFLKNKLKTLLKTKNYLEALKLSNRVKPEDNINSWVELNKANIYRTLKQQHNELDNLSLYLNKEYKDHKIRYRRALLLIALKKMTKAENDLKILADKNIFYKDSALRLTMIRFKDKDYKNAEQLLKTWTERNPKDIKSLKMLSYIYIKNKKIESAINSYSNILEIDHTLLDILYERAKLLVQVKKFDHALKDINELLSFYPENKNYLMLKIRILENSGETAELESFLQKLVKLDGNNIKARKKIAEIYFSNNEINKALQQLNKIIAKDNSALQSYFLRGMCNLKIKEYDNAIIDFSKVLELDNNNEKALYNRANIYLILKDYNKSYQDFKNLISLYNYNSDYFLKISQVEFKLGKLKMAKEHYNKAKNNNVSLPEYEYYFSDFQRTI